LVSKKEMRFQGKNKDLNQLSQQIADFLKNDGYKVQSATGTSGPVIQAQKAGILRDIITADRCFTIALSGQPNDFTVTIGIGKWVQNIAVAAAEVLLLSALFLAVDVPEMLWTVHVENAIAKKITEMVG
jgi:tetrahydromethanopterin S-methyltransferase subunit E